MSLIIKLERFNFPLATNHIFDINFESENPISVLHKFTKLSFDKIDLYNDNYNFKTWLISISKNIFIDSIRGKKKETISLNKGDSEAYLITDASPSPEDQIINEQNLAQLLSYIKKLNNKQQKIITLRYFQELSYKEISESLNESMSSVKVNLLRAKKSLAEIIAQNK